MLFALANCRFPRQAKGELVKRTRSTLHSAVQIVLLVALVTVSSVASGCSPSAKSNKAITIGYIGGFSGRAASLGIAGRDGALLAVEEANAKSGDPGAPIFTLEAVDDGVGAAAAADAVSALAGKGARAIIGPMTSASAVAAAPVADRLRIPMLSPTASTDELSGRDDYFLRIYPDNRSAAKRLVNEVLREFPAARVAVIYDLGNEAHTQSWANHFQRQLKLGGGSIESSQTFVSGDNPDYTDLAEGAAASPSDCVFLIANAIDSAMIAQRLRAAGSKLPIFASEWSATADLVSTGGAAVDGMVFLNTYDRGSRQSDFVSMSEAFRTRFGYDPGFAAVHAYGMTSMLVRTLSAHPDSQDLRSELLTGQLSTTIQGTTKFDRFGDVALPYYVMTIEDGQFTRLDDR